MHFTGLAGGLGSRIFTGSMWITWNSYPCPLCARQREIYVTDDGLLRRTWMLNYLMKRIPY